MLILLTIVNNIAMRTKTANGDKIQYKGRRKVTVPQIGEDWI